jgi:hypothetical protein
MVPAVSWRHGAFVVSGFSRTVSYTDAAASPVVAPASHHQKNIRRSFF